MLIDAWWFNNTQSENEILQPDCFAPRAHFGIYAELPNINMPLKLNICATANGVTLYEKGFIIDDFKHKTDEYEVEISKSGNIIFTAYTQNTDVFPADITVSAQCENFTYTQSTKCKYAKLSGNITDFNGNPFPAAFKLCRIGFNDNGMGVWSDKNGVYSIIVPKGIYNAFYVCDNSYNKTSLENWSWHMIVDQDEKHDFKVGTGEVYSLCAWANNGGFGTLFLFFRPMFLSTVYHGEYSVEINKKNFTVTDICPKINIDDINVTMNGYRLENISLQQFYETGGQNNAMPAYILQVRRYPENSEYSTRRKQTLILEYISNYTKGDINITATSQGRTQFFYKDVCAFSLR
jgi:hypothetical protein